MSRPTFSLCRLNASADPALIQQTKLSPLNAKQKSSLAVIMHPHRPMAPQSTVPPAPLTSPTSLSLPTALYIRQIVQADQPQQWLNAAGLLWVPVGAPWMRLALSGGCLIGWRAWRMGRHLKQCCVQFLRRFLRMKAVCFCGADQEALVDMIKAIMSLGQTESISKLLLFIKLFRVFYLSPRRLCFLLWFFVWFDIGIKK